MSKSVSTFTAQLVTFETTCSVSDVLVRLDKELNRPNSGQIWSFLQNAEGIAAGVDNIDGAYDFLCGSISEYWGLPIN
jgi:hypothetical protein